MININVQTYSCDCAIECRSDLSRPPWTSEEVWKKHPEHLRQPFSVQGWFDISVKRVFIEPHRASLSHPFSTMSPFQPRHYWQACSLTGKAITSAHWQKIACCANRFGGRLKDPNAVHYISDNIHSFFNALLHTSKGICLKMPLCSYVVFHSIWYKH